MTIEEVSNFLEQIKNIILNSNSWTGEAKTIVEKCFNTAIKSLEAWEQIEEYAKVNWNGDRDIRDYIRRQLRHLSEVSE